MQAQSNAPMNIGLDWDGTVTREPKGFLAFAKTMKMLGHKVYIVTMRYPSECSQITNNRDWMLVVEQVVATCRGPKRPAMEALGIKIDIWIDDNPRAVEERAKQIWGSESPEGMVYVELGNGEVAVEHLKPAEGFTTVTPDWNPLKPFEFVDTEPTLNTQGLGSDDPAHAAIRPDPIMLHSSEIMSAGENPGWQPV